MSVKDKRLHIVLISIHGLIRGNDLELGRDADTGGQTKYVLELARALAKHPDVRQVDLITRLIKDPEISEIYAQETEKLDSNCQIVRIPAGPDEYIAKELLWDHLDAFTDNLHDFLFTHGLPDIIHSHYADAGYVGSRLSNLLGIPLIHTGHSLGRVKFRRLLAAGFTATEIEKRFNISKRIEAEEFTLASAELIITSTFQEIEKQYGLYDHYTAEMMRVIPPGTDLNRFHPPSHNQWKSDIGKTISRFLHNKKKPIILALSRPDNRKNIDGLLTAYGESKELQSKANLVIIAGNRDDIQDMEEGSKAVLTELLYLIDRYDLYGKVALPKHHRADDVPIIYQLAAQSLGIFVNPALTEPFGLTLIEAAATGLPIVATEDGGPKDIISNCKNGLLIDPLDTENITDTLLELLNDKISWINFAAMGLKGVRECYSWPAHADKYMEAIYEIIKGTTAKAPAPRSRRPMLFHDRAIVTDLDQNLLGDTLVLNNFSTLIRQNRKLTTFAIATGRRLDSALKIIKQYNIPDPDILITSGGAAIHYAPKLTEDTAWRRHIDHNWTAKAVRRILDPLPGLKLQPRSELSEFKISYYINQFRAPSWEEINSLLHQHELAVNVTISFGQFLDVLPIRASKGLALRYFASKWEIPLEKILVAGGSGGDEDMMRGNTLAVVVGNRHNEELLKLHDHESIYFAEQPYANGILEAIDYYDFFNSCKTPQTVSELSEYD